MTHISRQASSEFDQVVRALGHPDESVRLRAALRAGSAPASGYVDLLVAWGGVEPDPFVRDTLSWALIQHDHEQVMQRLLPELRSDVPRARAQALHTMSKVGDTRFWPAISEGLLTDADDDVARSAWRAAARLVPDRAEPWLADVLATQWGRGGRDVRLSLSQAFARLGDAAAPVVERAIGSTDEDVRWHALATKRIIDHPETSFDTALAEAKRVSALLGAPAITAAP